MSPRVLVVEHQASCPPALLGDWLTDAGAAVHVVRPYLADGLPDPASYDALLVLGGDMGANDDATVPWLAPLKQHIGSTVAAGVPVLGLCLGHQLVAAALGGTVATRPDGPVIGVEPVGWTAGAADDPLFAAVADARHAVHWNADVVVTAPPGTTTLAVARDGSLQVARFASAAWGIQSHPEVDLATCRRWAAADRDDHLVRGLDQEPLLASIEQAGPDLAHQWRPLADRFVRLAAGAGAVR